MKSTVLDESLSTNAKRVLFQGKTTLLLQETTELEIYISSGSGLVLLIVICCMLYWCCKRTQKLETRLPACATNADPENPNMLYTRVGAIGINAYLVPGQETVGIQDPVGTQHMVLSNDMQFAFISALLDQLGRLWH